MAVYVCSCGSDRRVISLSTSYFLCVGIEDVLPVEITLFGDSSRCRFSLRDTGFFSDLYPLHQSWY